MLRACTAWQALMGRGVISLSQRQKQNKTKQNQQNKTKQKQKQNKTKKTFWEFFGQHKKKKKKKEKKKNLLVCVQLTWFSSNFSILNSKLLFVACSKISLPKKVIDFAIFSFKKKEEKKIRKKKENQNF